ncbi:MtN3 and saliva related transmembrane protein [Arenibacter algicola]|uniref:MtN3 and saliva related transmembrane protein n=2 Tax=Flavobacteriaceae TaxID=49546 RepID=A0A221UTA0_9FLAO|nr:sugar transporter SemiSWEET [Arenibacter algicola]GBF21391.1 PQ loop repeat protein [Arenibacter sp. NBRC 103722]
MGSAHKIVSSGMENIEIMGLVAAVLTTYSIVPQVHKTWRNKSTKDISLTMYMAMFLGVVLWLIYGIYHESVPMILANFITAVLLFVMIVLKLKYK